MVLIPPGKFTMGSPETEKGRDASREAQVEVILTQSYWLGKYEVTQAEYQQVMGNNPGDNKAGGGDTTRFPQEQVIWGEAVEFCRKLTEQEHSAKRLPRGWEYRLPTEAQWEYACRAGTTTATAFGDSLSSNQANFSGDSPYNGAEKGPFVKRTTTVGSYAQNAWGLHDMHGNVYEWCQDWYGDKLTGGVDPRGTQSGLARVYRGGCCYSFGQSCRSAKRVRSTPNNRDDLLGFRVALVQSNKSSTTSPPSFFPLQAGQKSGEEWIGNGFQMPFCWCPPGKFMMSSSETEKDRDANREAQVEVTLTQGFWMGKYEVTQSVFEKVMGKNPSSFSAKGSNGSKLIGQDTSQFPVESVTWTEAEKFCRMLTAQERAAGRLTEGWEYRLPTEAQWEYACRAGTTTATAFGDSLSSMQANFNGDNPYNCTSKGPNLGRPTSVGSYPANAWGLHDMHGNVWEWCQDWYDPILLGGTDPQGPQAGSIPMYRGGPWSLSGSYCRSSYRGDRPFVNGHDRGFRVSIALQTR